MSTATPATSSPLVTTISGKVVDGDKVGRTLGFPTANLDTILDEKQVDMGVYFGQCVVNKQTYDCLTYFGPRLVFNEVKNNVEVYIYDFADNIYGQTLEVTLQHFIRPPLPFVSLQTLQAQLNLDKKAGQMLQSQRAS